MFLKIPKSIIKRKEIKTDIVNKKRWYSTYYRNKLPLV